MRAFCILHACRKLFYFECIGGIASFTVFFQLIYTLLVYIYLCLVGQNGLEVIADQSWWWLRFMTSQMLDLSFLAVVDNREKYMVSPKRYDLLFRIRRVKVSIISSLQFLKIFD